MLVFQYASNCSNAEINAANGYEATATRVTNPCVSCEAPHSIGARILARSNLVEGLPNLGPSSE